VKLYAHILVGNEYYETGALDITNDIKNMSTTQALYFAIKNMDSDFPWDRSSFNVTL